MKETTTTTVAQAATIDPSTEDVRRLMQRYHDLFSRPFDV